VSGARGRAATQVAEPPDDPFGPGAGFGGMTVEHGPRAVAALPVATPVGGRADQAMAQIITAQRVAVKRDVPTIRREAREIATAMGDKAFYFWETKNRDGTRGQVMGPSIDCAMAAISAYGNCSIEAFPAQETDSHWVFLARFVDYEKGVTVTRSFQQRKSQKTGMKDADRQQDIVFQIGQSKASRNAVVAGLKWLVTEMVEAARSGLLEKVKANPAGARDYLLKSIAALDIPLAVVERAATRKAAAWTAPDMAKLYGQIQSIKDGMVTWQDVFAEAPADDGGEEETTQQPRGVPQAGPVGESPKPAPAAVVKKKDPPPPADEERDEAPADEPGQSDVRFE
jgi:hypothetical protein